MNITKFLKVKVLISGILMFLFIHAFSFGVYGLADETDREYTDTISITFFVDTEEKLIELQNQFGTENIEYLPEINLVNMTLAKSREAEFQKYNIDYTILPAIDTETVMQAIPPISPYILLNNPNYSNFNWAYARIMEPLGGKSSNGGEGVKIAIIDSGVDSTHPGFQDNIISQINFSTSENNEDEYGHGTQVAGVIDSLAPKAILYTYKVMDESEGESFDIIRAIVDATKQNVDIINVSLGTEKDSNTCEQLTILAFKIAIAYARSKGIFVVGSAGNNAINLDEQGNKVHLPGGLNNVITVGSTIKDGLIADYSNYGTKVSVYGPTGWLGYSYQSDSVVDAREMMITYYPTTKISPFETPDVIPRGTTLSFGTSLAAPEVTSALATLISKYKTQGISYSYSQIKRELMRNTQIVSENSGAGIREVRIYD